MTSSPEGGGGGSQKVTNDNEGGEGGSIPPKNDDVIYEQPLTSANIFYVLSGITTLTCNKTAKVDLQIQEQGKRWKRWTENPDKHFTLYLELLTEPGFCLSELQEWDCSQNPETKKEIEA